MVGPKAGKYFLLHYCCGQVFFLNVIKFISGNELIIIYCPSYFTGNGLHSNRCIAWISSGVNA